MFMVWVVKMLNADFFQLLTKLSTVKEEYGLILEIIMTNHIAANIEGRNCVRCDGLRNGFLSRSVPISA
jgi:hypothetical protein